MRRTQHPQWGCARAVMREIPAAKGGISTPTPAFPQRESSSDPEGSAYGGAVCLRHIPGSRAGSALLLLSAPAQFFLQIAHLFSKPMILCAN
jgi:hypothetical protein